MSQNEAITITLNPTKRDYFQGGILTFRENYKWPFRIAIVLSLPFAIFAFAVHFMGAPPGERMTLYGFDWLIVLPLVVYFFPHWFYYLVTGTLVRTNPRLTEETRVEYSTKGISMESSAGQANLNWSIYQRVTETPKYFLLYTAPRIAGALPKRCFSSPEDLQAFRNLVRHTVSGPVKLLD